MNETDGWIDVKERLPETKGVPGYRGEVSGPALVWLPEEEAWPAKVEIARCYREPGAGDDRVSWYGPGVGQARRTGPTHWQPLPAPPAAKEG